MYDYPCNVAADFIGIGCKPEQTTFKAVRTYVETERFFSCTERLNETNERNSHSRNVGEREERVS